MPAESIWVTGGATNHVVNDITISNQWGTPTNIIIRNRTGKGQGAGGHPPTNMIVDLPNGNTISYANNPIIAEYKLDGTGFPHALLAKCLDMTKGWCDDGQTNSLYIGRSKVFSVDDSSGNVSTAGHLNQSATGKFAGSCAMLNATTCLFSISTTFTSAPLGFASVQSATPIPGSCTLSGTTVTITASTMNTNTWGCLLIGNPN